MQFGLSYYKYVCMYYTHQSFSYIHTYTNIRLSAHVDLRGRCSIYGFGVVCVFI